MNAHFASVAAAQSLAPDFLAFLLHLGVIKPPRRRELRRWELREAGKLPPHTHARERARRKRQINRIAGKERARVALSRWGRSDASPSAFAQAAAKPSGSAVRRKLREFPHVYI